MIDVVVLWCMLNLVVMNSFVVAGGLVGRLMNRLVVRLVM